jgi:hypothetical protein
VEWRLIRVLPGAVWDGLGYEIGSKERGDGDRKGDDGKNFSGF